MSFILIFGKKFWGKANSYTMRLNMDLDFGAICLRVCFMLVDETSYIPRLPSIFLSWKQFEYKASFAIDFLRKPFKVFAPWIKYYVKGACLSFVHLNLVIVSLQHFSGSKSGINLFLNGCGLVDKTGHTHTTNIKPWQL